MKKTLTATAMLLSLGASGASAQVLNVSGSDTLGDLMNDPVNGLLQLCPAANTFIDYLGGGSTTGENAAIGDTQEIAPMSRFLNSAACSHNPNQFSGCFRHSLDGLAVAAVETAGEDCDTVRWSGSMALPSGGTYTFSNWRTVLRIVYGGQAGQPDALVNFDPCTQLHPARSPIAEKDCAGEVRRTLVDNWGNMFAKADGTACTNGSCTALKHAFRRDDVSGTTDTFLELLALPAVSNTPFCNGTEIQDNDPIRRQCTGNGYQNGEQVCKGSNPANPTATSQGLGVVLPVLIPQQNAFPANPASMCAPSSIGGAAFGDVGMPFGTASCPNGAALNGGTCKWPRKAGTASGNFDCLAAQNDRPAGTPTTFDGRAYNQIPRNAAGQILTYQRRTSSGGTSNLNMTSAFYRIHQNKAISGSTLAAGTGCAFTNETQQIGCLVEASPCSIGYSGLTALNDQATNLPDANRKGLGLRSSVPGSNVAVFPSDDNVRLLLQPSGGACTPSAALNGGFEDRYPFARGLWACTVDGIPGVAGQTVWETTGSQTADQLNAQAALVSCFQNRTLIDQAASNAGFVTLDSTGTAPVQFVTCADMALP